MKIRSLKGRRGQTTIEYILLLGMVTGVIALVRELAEPEVARSITALVEMAQQEAWVGGKPTPDLEKPYGYYYNDSNMKVD